MPAQPLAAVLLAAGAASRFGSPKQLAEIHGVPLVRRMAQAILGCGTELVVVTGARADEVAAALGGLRVRLAHNPFWELGMGESIARGFREFSRQLAPPEACLLCLVDQPLVGTAQLQRLIEQHRAEPRSIVVSDHGEAVGPPCLFPAAYYGELSQLSGAQGARSVLQQHREAVRTVSMPEAALDIDRPEDHLRALDAMRLAAAP
ncbi:MAG: nucleotidyltransferase family protein [Nevskia sp.]|nr:nucleotidyltransferase family protein [Nevskia sp.]